MERERGSERESERERGRDIEKGKEMKACNPSAGVKVSKGIAR